MTVTTPHDSVKWSKQFHGKLAWWQKAYLILKIRKNGIYVLLFFLLPFYYSSSIDFILHKACIIPFKIQFLNSIHICRLNVYRNSPQGWINWRIMCLLIFYLYATTESEAESHQAHKPVSARCYQPTRSTATKLKRVAITLSVTRNPGLRKLLATTQPSNPETKRGNTWFADHGPLFK